MAKYLALRHYATVMCPHCGIGCNPTMVTIMKSGGGAFSVPVHCSGCGHRLVCPKCSARLLLVKRASNNFVWTAAGGVQFMAYTTECSSPCAGGFALAQTVQQRAATTQPTPTPRPQGALMPTPMIFTPDIVRAKVLERVKEAIHLSAAQGHKVPGVVVLDLSAGEKTLKLSCDDCKSYVDISLERHFEPPVSGTALAFHCKQMMKGQKK